MNLFYQPGIPDGVLHLDGDESKHCVRVLRKRSGDAIGITDGKGFFYDAIITKADAGQCLFEIRQKQQAPEKDYFIHIAISPTKNADRIEWFVEKATELGVDRISLMDCKNTERSFIKTERLQKVAISAMKQSVKAIVPSIEDHLLQFTEVVEQCREQERCIAFVDAGNPLHLRDAVKAKRSYCVLIGPEGDFSTDELTTATEYGFRQVSLGPSRLRTETAGLAACHVLNLVNYVSGEW
ncbi:MAG: 16S rRNA (uracil(1498)-N(3))-methyltransferase [Cyclobacteriaceae bacterium]